MTVKSPERARPRVSQDDGRRVLTRRALGQRPRPSTQPESDRAPSAEATSSLYLDLVSQNCTSSEGVGRRGFPGRPSAPSLASVGAGGPVHAGPAQQAPRPHVLGPRLTGQCPLPVTAPPPSRGVAGTGCVTDLSDRGSPRLAPWPALSKGSVCFSLLPSWLCAAAHPAGSRDPGPVGLSVLCSEQNYGETMHLRGTGPGGGCPNAKLAPGTC